MPSLLQSALNASSPRSPVESPRSPIEETTTRKRKLETSPYFRQGQTGNQISPRSPVEEANTGTPSKRQALESPLSPVEETRTPAKSKRRIVESPLSPVESPPSPIEEASTRFAPARPFIESPSSPVQETSSVRLTPARQNIESPSSPIEETGPPEQLPGRNTTSQKKDDLLSSEASNRFIPQTVDGVEDRNPAKFSLKPPYWRKWDSKLYVTFAEHLRWQFDPTPFAKEHGIPVEEVAHVFNAVVCNPLYKPKEAARRGEEGMAAVMELYRAPKYATPKRKWGKDAGGPKELLAELRGVQKGKVELIWGISGNKKVVTLEELNEQDVKYLRETLSKEDKKVLWG